MYNSFPAGNDFDIESARRKAEQLMENGEHREAVKLLLSLQTHYPEHSGLMNDLGAIFTQTGMPDLGKSYFERALYLNLNDEDARANLQALESFGLEDDSIEDKSRTANDAPKILFAAEYLDPPYGGAEESAIAILKALVDDGYDVTGVCKGEVNKYYWKNGIRCRHVTNVESLIKACEFDHQDLVLTQLNWGPVVTAAAKGFGKPVFLFVRSYEHFCPNVVNMIGCNFECEQCQAYQQHKQNLLEHRRMLDKVDRIFSNSEYMNQFQKRFSGRDEDVIYPVINFDKVIPPVHDPAFVTLGRPDNAKGLFILDAVAKLNPEVKYLAFGRHGGLPPMIAKNILFFEHGDPRIMYSKARIMLMPSIWAEPFGRIPLEAMANGIPVIASRVGGLPEAGGDAALYIDEYTDPDKWHLAIERVENEPGLFQSMREKGFEQVKLFKARDDIGKLKSIIKETINRSAGTDAGVSAKTFANEQRTPAKSEPASSNGGKRSLHLKTPYYLPISETFIYNCFRNLKRYPPVILTNEIRNMEIFPLEHPIIRFNHSPAEDPSFQTFIREICARFNPQLIHTHFGHIGAEAVEWAEMNGLPLIASFYGKDASTYLDDPEWRQKFASLFHKAAAITVLSRDMKRRLAEAGCPQDKINIIHLGLNLKDYPFKRRILNPGEPVKFLCVGRLVEKKGFDDALRALAQARKAGKCQLRIIGEGPEDEKLRALAIQLRVEKDVFFLGGQPVSYVRDEMAVNHILLAPSKAGSDGDKEGTPTVLMEAQACGLPIISTFHAGIPEVVEDGASASLIEEGDWSGLAQRMIQLIKQPELWPRMGTAGRKKVELDFNIEIETEKLEKLYDKTVNRQEIGPIQKEKRISVPGRKSSAPMIKSNGKLHIAVDAFALEDEGSKVRGIGRFMLNQFKELISLCSEWRFTICGLTDEPFLDEVRYLIGNDNCSFNQWKDFPDLNPDILYLTHPMSPVTSNIMKLGLMTETPMVCTFYDLIPLIFPDLYLKPDPEFDKLYRSQLDLLKKHCRLFLCDSQCTADDLEKHLGVLKSRLKVIYAGVTDNFSQAPTSKFIEYTLRKYQLERERFLLFTGVPDQRKNAPGMFIGLAKSLKAIEGGLKLAIVGDMPEFLLNFLKDLEAKCNVPKGAVIYTGFVSEEELNAFYHGALGLLFTSLYEGFGFPIVEANSAGLPVIGGRNSSQIEVAGGSALLINAYNADEIADAIVSLYRNPDLRATLRERGSENYKRFTWRKTAEKTAEFLLEFAAAGDRTSKSQLSAVKI
ncbi:MAG: glycosyltransferase [candidate division Zixibacteria bacterium]|nr:glycosyltransferase [Candidatus Tariuqbacter arcticus]